MKTRRQKVGSTSLQPQSKPKREPQWAIRIPGSDFQSDLLGHYTVPSSPSLKCQMTLRLLCWLSRPLFLEDELVFLPCQPNHSGWASICVFNPHSLASSLSCCQKITAFSLNGVGTVSCPCSPYLNFCVCGGDWRRLIHQLLCHIHIDKHKRHLLLYHVLWWLPQETCQIKLIFKLPCSAPRLGRKLL